MSNKKWFKKWFKWLSEYEQKIVLTGGLLVVSIISFEAGVIKGGVWQQKPLIINGFSKKNTKEFYNKKNNEYNNEYGKKKKTYSKKCVFVASKKSKKYHKADCYYARKIKVENKICFEDEKDARRQGYIPAHCLKSGK